MWRTLYAQPRCSIVRALASLSLIEQQHAKGSLTLVLPRYPIFCSRGLSVTPIFATFDILLLVGMWTIATALLHCFYHFHSFPLFPPSWNRVCCHCTSPCQFFYFRATRCCRRRPSGADSAVRTALLAPVSARVLPTSSTRRALLLCVTYGVSE